MDKIELEHQKELAAIEENRFKNQIAAIGRETLVKMAQSGPETQAKLLKGLGLKGFMVMDGKNPINLMSQATGMLGNQQ